ncbi:hypothetical protein [Bacteroides sp. BFG-606]|uniref:hypothetical protein n=1 Tax=Bacteroides sp. BFG-606 TaxID=2972763 RepID=UPI0021654745|nr:hypothetical protein [Bacteroides sp. BFG-606]MCS2335447.1 hypothetical protein [Bacteroides sp. BFG-606]
MGAIGLNPIRLDRIGLDPIRINAIRLGVPGAASGSDRPYIDPEVLASLKAVCICYGKSNDDPDRAVVKNLVDPDNPFIISNAAYKLNSGYGKYEEDFTSWDRIDASTAEISNDGSKIKCINTILNVQYLFNSINKDIPSFKVKISNFTEGNIVYYYRKEDGTEAFLRIEPSPLDKVLELPKSYNTVEGGTGSRGGFYSSNINIGVTIEQIPSYQGAFVTDGVNDLITSTKTVQEMGITDEITVVSMVHQVKDTTNNVSFTNYIRGSINGYFRNIVNNYGKTGIYGYTSSDLRSLSVINNILGDKNDYTSNGDNRDTIINGNFSVQGYSYNNSNNTGDFSSVAWYWTVIANKVLTTDQINQVIAYYNLDRCVEPTVWYDVQKQGLSNDTPDSDWYLKDFSKNGFDMSLFNFAKDGDSGIGKYNYPNWKINVTQGNKYARIVCYNSINGTYSADFKGITDLYKSYGLSVEIRVSRANTIDFHSIKEDGIYTITPPDDTTSIDIRFGGENVYNASCDITVTQIPSHAGALCFDGVEDYGKVTGLPIYKDYTVVADREIVDGLAASADGGVALKGSKYLTGAFAFDYKDSCWSFGGHKMIPLNTKRFISYQSKYVSNGISVDVGTATDNDELWIGRLGNEERYSKLAIRFLMSFPYSLSEFLIERQLKKHKLGTLYPDMVEFRPVITTNTEYNDVVYYAVNGATWTRIYEGEYIPIGQMISITINLKSVDEISKVVSSSLDNISIRKSSGTSNAFDIVANITSKSPQKIDITIDEYIRYEDIVQPYPVFFEFYNENNELFTWGDKVKVGSTITRTKGVAYSNLLEGLYTITNPRLNGVQLAGAEHTVEKQMVFTCDATYIKGSNAPKCILSPSRLRIPNSSYKILGYIPDISGHGNHGKINNSAYAEGSGVNADGSYQLDGVDDFITIPTLSNSGKQILMKINWNTEGYNKFIADFRGVDGDRYYIVNELGPTVSNLAYQNVNKTYIDGIFNNNIKGLDLKGITHNITSQLASVNSSPYIGARTGNGDNLTMALYDFMLFDEISTDEEILTLNEYVGIEGNTDDLFTENN